MIHILGKVPRDFCIAVSGGIDSMAALNFLLNGKHNPHVVHFNHGTEHAKDAEWLVRGLCGKWDVELTVGYLKDSLPKGRSKEDFWREKRYNFFRQFNKPVITAHHLDDVLEWWIFSCLHGEGKIIPYKVYNTHPYKARQSNHCIIRPFLLTDKHSFTKWALRKFDNPEPTWWMDDPSNDNTSFKRNYIRHNVVKHAEEINPGIRKVLRKKIKTHASYKRLGLEEL